MKRNFYHKLMTYSHLQTSWHTYKVPLSKLSHLEFLRSSLKGRFFSKEKRYQILENKKSSLHLCDINWCYLRFLSSSNTSVPLWMPLEALLTDIDWTDSNGGKHCFQPKVSAKCAVWINRSYYIKCCSRWFLGVLDVL